MDRARTVLAAIGAAVAATLVLAGCSAPHQSSGVPDARLAGQWVLQTASDQAGVIPAESVGIYATLTIGPGQQSGGRGPCHDYAARIIGEPGAVFVATTPKSGNTCTDPTLVGVDKRYIAALNATTVASVKGAALDLRGDSTNLTFARAPIVRPGDFTGAVWVAQDESFGGVGGGGDFHPLPGTVKFSKNGSFNAQSGDCLTTGTWRIDAGEVVAERAASIRLRCGEDADAANLSRLLGALEGGFHFVRTVATLQTTNPRSLDSVRFVLSLKIGFDQG